MVQVSKKRISELQKILKEDYKKEVSFKEASEAAHNLIGFFDLLWKIDKRHREKNKN